MAIQCIFFAPRDGEHCQVLEHAADHAAAATAGAQLADRFCVTGRFVVCPVFCRVEQGLLEAEPLRAGLSTLRARSASVEATPHVLPPPD